MAQWTKYNNPARKRRKPIRKHNPVYQAECRKQLENILARCETEAERDMAIKAYNVARNF